MKRLTKQTDSKERTTIGMPKAVACYWELKKIEDVEEKHNMSVDEMDNYITEHKKIEKELDIELITLLRVLTSDHIYGFTKDIDHEEKYISWFPMRDIVLNKFYKTLDVYYECESDKIYKQYKLKDYGKTWALTKEELKK